RRGAQRRGSRPASTESSQELGDGPPDRPGELTRKAAVFRQSSVGPLELVGDLLVEAAVEDPKVALVVVPGAELVVDAPLACRPRRAERSYSRGTRSPTSGSARALSRRSARLSLR